MTTIVIEPALKSGTRFRARARDHESFGSTMGEALDALMEGLDEADQQTSILAPDFRPDEFFTEEQQRRLSYLMTKWRSGRDHGTDFSEAEQIELEQLVATELEGSANRLQALIHAS